MQRSIHLLRPSNDLSLDLTIVLSTDIQNWHDYHTLKLPNSTAQCELINMPHYLESCISRFFVLFGDVGCNGSLC
jgi:hypothetical protein